MKETEADKKPVEKKSSKKNRKSELEKLLAED